MKKAEDGASGGAEEAGEWKMNAGDHAVQHVGAHVLYRQQLHDRILRKQREEWCRDELKQNREQESDPTGDADAVFERLPRTHRISGTDGLRRNRRHSRQHAGRHQEKETDRLFDDPDRGRNIDAAAVCNHRDDQKRNLNESVLTRNREADTEDLPQHRRVKPDASIHARYFTKRHRLPDADERECHRCRLCHHRRERRTRCAQLHWPHQQEVEQDVESARYCDEDHRAATVAHTTENRAQNVVGDDERDAGEADAKV